jgi:hypothetical protein
MERSEHNLSARTYPAPYGAGLIRTAIYVHFRSVNCVLIKGGSYGNHDQGKTNGI